MLEDLCDSLTTRDRRDPSKSWGGSRAARPRRDVFRPILPHPRRTGSNPTSGRTATLRSPHYDRDLDQNQKLDGAFHLFLIATEEELSATRSDESMAELLLRSGIGMRRVFFDELHTLLVKTDWKPRAGQLANGDRSLHASRFRAGLAALSEEEVEALFRSWAEPYDSSGYAKTGINTFDIYVPLMTLWRQVTDMDAGQDLWLVDGDSES